APRGFVEVSPAAATARGKSPALRGESQISVTISTPGLQVRTARLSMPPGERITNASIFDTRGRLIARLNAGAQNSGDIVRLTWDGRDRRGGWAGAGTYLVKVRGTRTERAAKLTLRS
ncbi:MAG: hypothetical protein GF418_07530, partial [Chitinivibrionales bacterium]|nr:hypothetical protein [Chitinivibrionales bacterium]MBD3395463.1 hypothetical protein [Chitinivibrionales bacterium]